MNIKTFDLNLLCVFAAIFAERSVSRAASTVGLSQPAMSNALLRLRKTCSDPLFVRTTSGMEPTALARALIVPVRQALGILQECLDHPLGFDPLRSDRAFRLLMSDAGELAVLPALTAALRKWAPNVVIEAVRIPHGQYAEALQNGAVDLAIGNLPFLKAGFYQTRLFEDPYCCIARRGHPLARGGLDISKYLQARHVSIATGNADELVDRALTRSRLVRSIKLRVTHYQVAVDIVAATDLFAAVPLNTTYRARSIEVLPLPMKIPAADVRLFWHRIAHKDPANQWLRSVVSSLKFQPRTKNRRVFER